MRLGHWDLDIEDVIALAMDLDQTQRAPCRAKARDCRSYSPQQKLDYYLRGPAYDPRIDSNTLKWAVPLEAVEKLMAARSP